jgi:hypothetical protein
MKALPEERICSDSRYDTFPLWLAGVRSPRKAFGGIEIERSTYSRIWTRMAAPRLREAVAQIDGVTLVPRDISNLPTNRLHKPPILSSKI